MGILSGIQKRSIVDQIQSLSDTTLMRVYIPTIVYCSASGCGYDPITRSGVNSTCLTCQGTGLVGSVSMGYIPGRVSWIDQDRIGIYSGLPTGPKADCQFQCATHNKATLELVARTEGAYVEIDDVRLVPQSIVINRVESQTSLDVRLFRINPELTGE